MRIIQLLFCLFSLALPAQGAPLGLREAADYAIHHSPVLSASERQLLVAQLQQENASAAFLPSLDLTSSHGLQRTYPLASGSNPWASSFALNLTEKLYDNGESLNNLRITRLQEEARRLFLARDRDRLILAVANAFYALNLANKTLEIQQEQHAVLKLQVELVKDAYRQGLKTRKDYLRFQTQLNRADIDLGNARDAVKKAELELRRILGVPLEGEEALSFRTDESKPVTPAPFRLPLENHRDYRLTELQRHVQNLTAAQVRRKLWPVLGISAGASYGSSSYLGSGKGITPAQQKSWNALLTLDYNILDWGIRRRNAEIASEQAMIQVDSLSNDLLTLRADIGKMSVDLRQQQENFRLSEELLKLERANFALITNEYRQGKVQYLDYITSLQNFASAKSSYYSSLYEVKRGIINQLYHEGVLYEAIEKP